MPDELTPDELAALREVLLDYPLLVARFPRSARRSSRHGHFHAAAAIDLPVIGSPTYTNVEDLNTVFHSAGWISGGVISDAGSETIDVAVGAGMLRSSDSPVAQLLFFDWSASTGLAIPTDTIRYIGLEYNAGSPQVIVRTSDNFDHNTDFPLGTVVNEAGTLHIQNAPWEVGDHARAMIERARGTAPIARDKEVGGLIFSETGTRNVAVTAGQLWRGLTAFVIGALDTDPGGAADTFDTYSAGGQEATGVAAWPNEQYDNAGTLTNLGNNKWANLWWYIELDGELVMVYGTNQYVTQAQAEAEAAPSVLPNRLQVHGVLAARFIFQKSAGTAAEILSAFDTTFQVEGVTDHGNLAGLSDVAADHPHGISAHISHANWKALYTDGSGDEQELALGVAGTVMRSASTSSAPTMTQLAHSDLADAPTDTHHAEAHGRDKHQLFGNWSIIYTDGVGDQQVLALGAAGGLLEMKGTSSAPVVTVPKRTIDLMMAGGAPTTTAGASATTQAEGAGSQNNYWYADFAADADDHVFWTMIMPDNWDGGTVTFKVYWSTTATDTDGVAWGLRARSYGDNEAIDQAFGTGVVVTDDVQSAAATVLITAASGALTIGGTPAAGEYVIWDAYRDVSDANDDMTENARLLGIKVEYGVNAVSDAG